MFEIPEQDLPCTYSTVQNTHTLTWHRSVRIFTVLNPYVFCRHVTTNGYRHANLLLVICKNKLLLHNLVIFMHNHYFMLTKFIALLGVNAGTTKHLFLVPQSIAVSKKRSPNMPDHKTSSVSTSLLYYHLSEAEHMLGHFLATTYVQPCWNLCLYYK